jgi:hypothetical protein
MSRKTNQSETAEHRRRKVIALFADPATKGNMTEIAKLLGVSTKTVQRDLEAVRPDVKEAQGMLEEYKRRFAEQLPIEKRVSAYKKITESTNPFAVLKALERIDELSGIMTDEQLLKSRTNDAAQAPQPMFVFQGGMNIDFGGGAAPSSYVSTMREITPEAEPSTPADEGSPL